MLGDEQIGYVAQRYESLPEKKQLKAIYFVHARGDADTTTEGLTALSDENFEPILYNYTALVKGKAKTIDATFKNKKMTAKVTEGGKTKTITLDVKPNGFLSVFLNYVILKNGLMAGKSYGFNAIAEEEARFYEGQAAIKSEQMVASNRAFKIDFKFKEVDFTGLVTTRGDTLGSLQQNIRTELVATRAEAMGPFKATEKALISLFGSLPVGNINPLAQPTPTTKANPVGNSAPQLTTGGTPPVAPPANTTSAPPPSTNLPPSTLPKKQEPAKGQ